MVINLDDYRLSKGYIQKKILESKDDLNRIVSTLSATTFVPLIVVLFYAGEVLGWSTDILDKIDEISKFYGYTKVLGIPESYPKK